MTVVCLLLLELIILQNIIKLSTIRSLHLATRKLANTLKVNSRKRLLDNIFAKSWLTLKGPKNDEVNVQTAV